ncbi:MAG: hypothetical protein U0R80_00040 [Nocardioidaceae bacterium]
MDSGPALRRHAVILHPGEPEGGRWQVAGLPELLARLLAAAGPAHGRPVIVAIDGRGGAGKSVLARRLRELVPKSAVVHTDDIAWHHAMFDWGPRLRRHVVEPLRRGESVDFAPPEWRRRGRPGAVSVPGGLDVVWVEGTGILRSELADVLDAGVWVQGDLDEQERRLVERDGDAPEMRRHKQDWLTEELPFLLRERPWESATVLVDGTSDLPHDPDTEVVVGDRTPLLEVRPDPRVD